MGARYRSNEEATARAALTWQGPCLHPWPRGCRRAGDGDDLYAPRLCYKSGPPLDAPTPPKWFLEEDFSPFQVLFHWKRGFGEVECHHWRCVCKHVGPIASISHCARAIATSPPRRRAWRWARRKPGATRTAPVSSRSARASTASHGSLEGVVAACGQVRGPRVLVPGRLRVSRRPFRFPYNLDDIAVQECVRAAKRRSHQLHRRPQGHGK